MTHVIGASPEGRSKIMVLAALLFAAIAAVLVYAALQRGGGDERSLVTTDTAPVVVAATHVPVNTILTVSMLEVRDMPLGSHLDGAFASTAGVVGLPTRFPLEAGEQITPHKVGLSRIDDRDDVALVLPQGQRAVAVEVGEVTGVGGLLLPGHFVDVIAVFSERSIGASSATTILQNVELLAVGQQAQEPIPAAGEGGPAISGQRPDAAGRQPDAASATLAVTPDDAQLLALVQEAGAAIWLSLRPVGDHDVVPSGQSDLAALLGQPVE